MQSLQQNHKLVNTNLSHLLKVGKRTNPLASFRSHSYPTRQLGGVQSELTGLSPHIFIRALRCCVIIRWVRVVQLYLRRGDS